MTVTILFPFVGDDIIGGSHVSALTVAAHLNRKRFQPLVLLHGEVGRLGGYVRSHGLSYCELPHIPITAPPYSRRKGNASIAGYMSHTLWALRRVVRRTGAAIVHTNDGRMHANWSLPARLAGAKHLWHHREDPNSRGANLLAPMLADRMLCVSHFSVPLKAARRLGDRVEVVRSPFVFAKKAPDQAVERAALLAEIKAPADTVIVGYVGSLIARKRPDVFVDVVRQVISEFPDREVRGVLFGEVDRPNSVIDRAVRAKAQALGIEHRVHLMGHRAPLSGPMAALDVLAVTALNEPFGRTLIEAMDLGVPVVATCHGGNVEAISDGVTGFLVPPDDVAAFARRIRQLVQDVDCRRRITSAAREAVHAELSLEQSVTGVERAYDELLGGPRRPVGEGISGRASSHP